MNSEWAAVRVDAVERALAAGLQSVVPERLREACVYPLQTGGKRIRPLLAVAACEAVGGDWEESVPAAVAVELVHTYSLVHDDLPCMDDDDERRGQPTVHVVYGENVAVLVGDALLTEAFAVLAGAGYPAAVAVRLVGELAHAAGGAGMIGGQALDVGLAGPMSDVPALLRLHRLKTGALIRAAVRMGGLVGAPGDSAVLEALDRFGAEVGLAFQIRDDLLDAEQDEAEGGPPSFVKVLGREGTRRAALEAAERACAAVAHLPGAAPLSALARFSVERGS